MKKLLKYLYLRLFRKFYFVSGTFDFNGERKWFRLVYSPDGGVITQNDIEKILKESFPKGAAEEYVVITNFFKISYKQHKNF